MRSDTQRPNFIDEASSQSSPSVTLSFSRRISITTPSTATRFSYSTNIIQEASMQDKRFYHCPSLTCLVDTFASSTLSVAFERDTGAHMEQRDHIHDRFQCFCACSGMLSISWPRDDCKSDNGKSSFPNLWRVIDADINIPEMEIPMRADGKLSPKDLPIETVESPISHIVDWQPNSRGQRNQSVGGSVLFFARMSF